MNYTDNIIKLVEKYKYKKLPEDLSLEVREGYLKELPPWVIHYNNEPIFSPQGILLANNLSNRKFVIGDYGAFLEINYQDMIISNLVIQPGEEYRIFNEEFNKRVKYIWLCPKSLEKIKIYHQKRRVSYADYIPNKFYISPYEVKNSIGGFNNAG